MRFGGSSTTVEIGNFAMENREKPMHPEKKRREEREREELLQDEQADEDSENRYRVYTKGERPKGALGCYPLQRERGM